MRRSAILYRTLRAGHAEENAAKIEAIETALLAKPGTRQVELTLPGADGRDVFCIVTKSTYMDASGETGGLVTAYSDVSALKRTEETLIAAKLAVEVEMHARSQFLANMSHEIRTPMNGVLGMTGLLQATLLSQVQREFVDTLKMSGEALLKIISDILNFPKIEASKIGINQAAFDIQARVTGMVQLFAASARERRLQLTHEVASDVPQMVLGDAVRIGQALSNLFANAIKFTLTGGVHLGVNVAARNGENVQLEFAVVDTGIGISQEALERIFSPFSQKDSSTTRRFGGTGLGPTISRELVQLMGGELHVESISGKGSRFTFTVTVLAQTTPSALDQAPAGIPNTRQPVKRDAVVEVLPAEDNKVNQMVARKMLEKLGCRVTVASDGAEAVDWAARQSFDLILMDCQMPNMDGFAATAAIRAMEKGGNVHRIIVAQTANDMEGDREVCLAASMDDYITKLFNTDKLAEIIQQWVPGAGGG